MEIALVGDYKDDVVAHRAIPMAIKLASESESTTSTIQWIHSEEIVVEELVNYSAFWCVPASPYMNMENVLKVIEYARSNNVPFLGTCGGYQHAALEYVRNALGYREADNAEVNPEAKMPLVAALFCKLYEVQNQINLVPGSFVQNIYEAERVKEEYNCGYGVNPEYLSLFEGSDMAFTGFDEDGDPRVLEIKRNNFFVGTAYQPERSALSGSSHPLIQYFVKCAAHA
jgi:CTP synthase (UTP-ammonia lyase)